MITKIQFSQMPPLATERLKSDNKDNKFQKNEVSFPKAYGYTNLAFCGKKHKKNKVTFKEFIEHSKKMQATAKPMMEDLHVLSPYGRVVLNSLKYLASNGTCLIGHNSEIDSKEIFISNLRSFIDTNMVQKTGFDRETPFVHINLNDYADEPTKAVIEMTKIINKECNNKHHKPILLVDGVANFFDRLDRPHEFAQNSIFKNYPTIFFMEEGFNVFKPEDIKKINIGMTPEDERDEKDAYFNEGEFHHILSKINFLKKSKYIKMPPISAEVAIDYLQDPNVQKHLLTNGHDIKFDEGTIEFTYALTRAMSYSEDHVYNSSHNNRLLVGDSPMNLLIDNLKRAVMFKLLRAPYTKTIGSEDVVNSLPDGTNWFAILLKYTEAEAMMQNKMQEKTEEQGKEDTKKVEPPKEEEVDKTKKDETPKPPEATTDKKDEPNSNFEVVLNPQTRFSDVGGMYNIKKQIKEEFIDILKNPKVKNNQKPSGVLLSGPPGCGKTLLARAIAGEAGVPFISTAGSSFIEMYVGVGPKRVRELYARAKEEAKKHPSKTAIVFIDEVDAVAGSRKNSGGSEDLRTINALLHEMDGASNKDEQDIKVITIVATNHEGMIDDAFKRSGRIDLKYKIDDPRYSIKAREEILKIHSKDLTFMNDKEKNKILHTLAQTTSGLSGADLAELLKKANRMSLRINRQNQYVTIDDIQEAKMQVQAGVKTDMEHTEFELKQTVAHEAGHAVNAMMLEKIFENEPNKHKMPSRVLDFITNSARGNALGATYFKPSEENKMGSKETNLSDLITLYGGYAIESLMFDTHSAGVSGDLKTATELIENAVSNNDFGSEKHYLSLNSELTKSLFTQELKQDIIKFAQKGMSISKKMTTFAKPFIENYLNELLKDKNNLDRTISADEFKEKFNGWLKKSKKTKEYQVLCTEIKQEIDDFCKEKGEERSKIGF